MREREWEGGREGGRRGEREKKVSTNRMLFSALTGTVCRCIHRFQCYWYVHSIVFPCMHCTKQYYSLDHMCHSDPEWSQVDTDSLCKHHTPHWASWTDSQCTHTSTRTHTISTYQYVNAKIHGFLILTHKINIH